MQTKVLLFVGWRAVFAARIKPVMAVENTIAGTGRSAKTKIAVSQRNWKAAGNAVIFRVTVRCMSSFVPKLLQNMQPEMVWNP